MIDDFEMPVRRPRFITVVDTDALLASVDNHTRSSHPTRLVRTTGAETCHLYAADHVYGEVYRRLPKIAATTPSSLAELRACFEEHYLPRLVFVTVSADNEPRRHVDSVTDVTTVPRLCSPTSSLPASYSRATSTSASPGSPGTETWR